METGLTSNHTLIENAMASKTRWLRISLRTFFVLFTCVAITFAWLAHYAQQRWAAFAAIREAGGDIRMGIGQPSLLEKWFGEELFGTVNKIDLRKGEADNALLAHIGNEAAGGPNENYFDRGSTRVDIVDALDAMVCAGHMTRAEGEDMLEKAMGYEYDFFPPEDSCP